MPPKKRRTGGFNSATGANPSVAASIKGARDAVATGDIANATKILKKAKIKHADDPLLADSKGLIDSYQQE